jgi:hypothetical protein
MRRMSAPESFRSEFARFRRDVRWMAALWLVTDVVLSIAVAVEGGSAGEVAAFFAALASLGVALTPLIWLRWLGRRPGGRADVGPRLKLLGVGLLWLAVVGGASISLLTAFGPR